MAFRGPERRLRTRYRVKVPFLLKGPDQPIRGITRNLSLLGISAYAESPVPQVQPVLCELNLPERNEPVAVQGTVIHCHPLETPHPDGPYEIGVFFKAFQGTAESELTQFLRRVAQAEEEAIQDGYRELKKRLAARKRRKRQEALLKLKRKKERLRKRRLREAAKKRRKAQKRPRGRPPKKKTAASRRAAKARV